MSWIVKGTFSNGCELWYTGKAGHGFMSSDFAQRFVYDSLEAARNRAKLINHTTSMHGYHCIVLRSNGKPLSEPDERERREDERAFAVETYWKEKQGENYGSY